jgi:hypothetical protein
MYITHEEYKQRYGEIEKTVFSRLSYDAGRLMDIHTTGIDNVKKLKKFFPQDPDDSEAVKMCEAKVISLLAQIQKAEEASAGSYEESEMGIRGRYITSITAGNESITYASGSGQGTVVDKAVSDNEVRESLLANTIRAYLSGVRDANGVNLLYMGAYPRRYLC